METIQLIRSEVIKNKLWSYHTKGENRLQLDVKYDWMGHRQSPWLVQHKFGGGLVATARTFNELNEALKLLNIKLLVVGSWQLEPVEISVPNKEPKQRKALTPEQRAKKNARRKELRAARKVARTEAGYDRLSNGWTGTAIAQ